MQSTSLVVLVFNFFMVAILPRIFFRQDGKFNFKWALTAWPFVADPVFMILGWNGRWSPLWTGNVFQESLAVFLAGCSLFLIGLTMGTNRIPLALWHQENDAPRNIVTWGAYTYIRHPFYTSFIIAYSAAVLYFPHWSTIAILIYGLVSLNLTAAREERRLSASEFGAEYKAFMAKTGRFCPKFF
jgi:protein-S-isoprenylcysteine O-methyltransferase Ste14